MTPKEAIAELADCGFSQSQIVSLLMVRGTKTTQETISRISTGAIKNPSYELGIAIVELCQSESPVDEPKTAAA